ncbi:MAG TPA: succinate dehydrogenase, cytochrome b556 subunit [Gammaproteobacteria bacterium]|nr:succinate dehydrogenase, cytochrome b556 subunit [Gammaproteobacteria bacterium]
MANKTAPKFLNLALIKLPPGGVASIGHRISGVLMFLSIPAGAWLLDLSLRGERGFRSALDYLHSPVALLLSVLLVWALGHHLLAGIRHLLLDIGIGLEKRSARLSARLVNAGGVILALLWALWLAGLT